MLSHSYNAECKQTMLHIKQMWNNEFMKTGMQFSGCAWDNTILEGGINP